MHVRGTGSYVPEAVLSSEALEARLGLEAGWIHRRTGIRERRAASPSEAVSDLAVRAGDAALRNARIERSQVRLVVLATSTPDHLLPATAPAVATRLGISAPAFDLAAACSGFLYGLALGTRWLTPPQVAPGEAVLVIGANVLTRRINWSDGSTAPLFGDGAGAVILTSEPAGVVGGVRGIDLHSDGNYWSDILIPAGGSRQPISADAIQRGDNLMVMPDGRGLFRRAVRALAASANRALENAGLTVRDIDWFVPHQGGRRIVEQAAIELGLSQDHIVSNLARYGNTSSASIPLALDEAVQDGRITPGSIVLLSAAGAGLTSAAAVIQWS